MILNLYLNETPVLEEMELNRALSECVGCEYLTEESQNIIIIKFKKFVEKVKQIIIDICKKIKQMFKEFRKKLPMYKKNKKYLDEIDTTIELESIFDLNDPKRISGNMYNIYDKVLDCVDLIRQKQCDAVIEKLTKYIENDYEIIKIKLDISPQPKKYTFDAVEFAETFKEWESLLEEQGNEFEDFSGKLISLTMISGEFIPNSFDAILVMRQVFYKIFRYLKELIGDILKLIRSTNEKLSKLNG